MGKLSKSITRDIGASKSRAFSSFDDFVSVLVEDGIIKSRNELMTEKADLLGSILFQWFVQGQIACAFAQLLAEDAVNWQSVVFKATVDAGELQSSLVDAADKLEALQLIFVGPATAEQAVELIKTLCKHESWSCYEMDWMEGEHGDSLLIGLRWNRPGSNYVSWVLGIAPFDPMPFTRRFVGAPFIALVFRPSPPTEYAPTPIERGLEGSHLAHMNDGIGADEDKRVRTRTRTQYQKQILLGDELRSQARAKVTFALPASCRKSLADVLTPIDKPDNSEDGKVLK